MIASELIKRHEGLRLKPYVDTVGKVTIGYGRNLSDVGISQAEAEMLFASDLGVAETIAKEFAGESCWEKLSDSRRAVLVDMAFNLGSGLRSFARFRLALQNENFEAAAEDMLDSLWARQVKGRAKELADLMKAEA